MELIKALSVVALLLCSSVNFIQSPSDVFGPVSLLEPTPSAARDFGAVVSEAPVAVMRPGSAADVARLLAALSSALPAGPGGALRRPRAATAVAARGAGHSLHGQAQARGGIVVETRALPRAVEVSRRTDGGAYADVGGGALWVEVLEECLKAGLAPRSWTDYLYLTVGGTLSNGGISGQAFKHGPQISNVLQLEVVTGTGEVVTCSPTQSPELFFAVLGGLGQFGIITRARIPLQVAPPKVRWVRAFYDSFETFTGDQELLVSMPELVDYVEGFMVLNEHSLLSSSVAFPAEINFAPDFGSDDDGGGGKKKKVYYCIEFAVHDFQQEDSAAADHVVELVLRKLSFLRPHAYSVEVAYFDFLNRVRMEEESLRSRGLWDVPHPWLNVFVPSHGAAAFRDLLMGTVTQGEFEGPVLIYPLLTDSATHERAPPEIPFLFLSAERGTPRSPPPTSPLVPERADFIPCGRLVSDRSPSSPPLPRPRRSRPALSAAGQQSDFGGGELEPHFGDSIGGHGGEEQAGTWPSIRSPGASICPPGKLRRVSSSACRQRRRGHRSSSPRARAPLLDRRRSSSSAHRWSARAEQRAPPPDLDPVLFLLPTHCCSPSPMEGTSAAEGRHRRAEWTWRGSLARTRRCRRRLWEAPRRWWREARREKRRQAQREARQSSRREAQREVRRSSLWEAQAQAQQSGTATRRRWCRRRRTG
ncbi:unnamed protein product [Urochloa humidicola]